LCIDKRAAEQQRSSHADNGLFHFSSLCCKTNVATAMPVELLEIMCFFDGFAQSLVARLRIAERIFAEAQIRAGFISALL
jgi:hypothetical protein